jgi:Uma2 family endonuclease
MATSAVRAHLIPPLRPGDHLTAEEFMRRYEAMPHLKNAELIEGVVYMPSPVTIEDHGTPHTLIITWLGTYWGQTPGVEPADNSTLLLDVGENRPQPDGLLRIKPSHGGQSQTVGKYVKGAPELVAEVAASSVSIDMHDKLLTYKRNSVLEYVVWLVDDKKVDWFVLAGGNYKPLPLSSEGYFKSKKFPGLWLDPQAVVVLDMARVLDVLQLGLSAPEHQKFVGKLKKRKSDR